MGLTVKNYAQSFFYFGEPYADTVIDIMQLAYFAAWPTLGTAVMYAAIPRNDRLVAVCNMSSQCLVTSPSMKQP